MLIGLSGLAGSGKSVVADRLVEKGWVEVALADEIKRIAMRLWDFNDLQLWGESEERNKPDKRYPDLTPRHVLQQLGTEVARCIDPDVWVRYTLSVVQKLQGGYFYYDKQTGLHSWKDSAVKTDVVIPDCRFKNEFEGIKKAGGKVVRILRPGAGLKGEAAQHRSETEQQEVPDEYFDYVIYNDGSLDHLILLIDRMIDVFKGRLSPYDEEQKDIPPHKRTGYRDTSS